MLRQLLAATSLTTLLAGAALAQDSGAATAPQATPPGATPAPTSDPAATPPAPNMPPVTAQGQVAPPAGAPETPETKAAGTSPAAPGTSTATTVAVPPPPPPADATATTNADATTNPTPTAATATPAPAGTGAGPVSTDDMMGRAVRGSDGEPLGRVSDVVIDSATGKIQRLVIASGGFLGIGAKTVALEFDKVEIRPEGGIVATGVTQADVEKLPTYDVAVETKTLSAPPPAAVVEPAAGPAPAAGLTPVPPGSAGTAAEPMTTNPNLNVGGSPRADEPPAKPAQ